MCCGSNLMPKDFPRRDSAAPFGILHLGAQGIEVGSRHFREQVAEALVAQRREAGAYALGVERDEEVIKEFATLGQTSLWLRLRGSQQ